MEKLNIAELLKDCPKGTKLYSPLCGECTFDSVSYGTIICKRRNGQEITFTSEGCHMIPIYDDCECLLFPSKENRDWSTFQNFFKDGDVVMTENGVQVFIFKENAKYKEGYYTGMCYIGYDFECEKILKKEKVWCFTQFATEEEKEKLFDAIKAYGYKWNAETKTLEKLEVKKFDITTLKPFESRVLVRDCKSEKWYPAIWGLKTDDIDFPYIVVGGQPYNFCIPYENNQHLLGTTNDCDDYYKTWE